MRCSMRGALGNVELGRLLGEQRIDLGIAAIGVGAALGDERSSRVAALPNAPDEPWTMFLSFFSL